MIYNCEHDHELFPYQTVWNENFINAYQQYRRIQYNIKGVQNYMAGTITGTLYLEKGLTLWTLIKKCF